VASATPGLLRFLLGGWVFATAAIGFVAFASFRALRPESLPRAAEVYGELGDAEAQRPALRYAASELNRYVFTRYHYAQVVLGAIALAAALAPGARSRGAVIAVTLALGIACASAFLLTPELVALGRRIDFVPRDPLPPEVKRFYMLHGSVEALELVKVALIGFAAWAAGRARTPTPSPAA
jgi:hypothetical protein